MGDAGDGERIIVLFRPVGNAPLLRQAKFKMAAGQPVATIRAFLRRQLHLEREHPDQPLFLYVNGAFAPTPDQLAGDLCRCHGVEGTLVINYSTTSAWG